MKKSIIAGTMATIVGGLVLMIIQNYLFVTKVDAQSVVLSSVPSFVAINLTGSNNDLNISNGGPIDTFASLNILGSNLSREISVGEGQAVTLRIIGSNNDIVIEKDIFSHVSVEETGSNNNVTKSVW